MRKQNVLRQLPPVDALAGRLKDLPHRVAVAAARLVVEELRQQILEGESVDFRPASLDEMLFARVRDLSNSSLRPVINATGVILHTNLGRAPIAAEAAEAAALAGASYTNLEYDLLSGKRGSRHAHVEDALCDLSGAEAAMAVNNNAAAVLLALAALGAGGEVIVSRGQLIEIGGTFRIPDIVACSGAEMREIGTTNRTRIGDYEGGIGPHTRAILRVHRSNFRMSGFIEEVSVADLCRLGERTDMPVIDDLGSGAIESINDEPTLAGSVTAGATIVCCSADKLLGGPQAGVLVGRYEAIERCRRHPFARAFRIDKMQLAALGATLRLHRFGEEAAIPALTMLQLTRAECETRARELTETIGDAASVISGTSRPGGGSLPDAELPGALCAVDPGPTGAGSLSMMLRVGEPPLVTRIANNRVLLDPRTIDQSDLNLAGELVRSALANL